MTKFLLIRHAATDAAGKRLAGRMPGVPLNEKGRDQAQKLAERLESIPVSAIYSSPLERTQETAAPLAEKLGLACVIDSDFIELDFGEWTNKAISELEGDQTFRLFNTFRSNTRIPGGETMAEAQMRIVSGLQKLYARHPGETVAVISHADVIKSAIAYYAGIHLDMLQRIEISPASVSMISMFDETAILSLLNHTGELTS